MGPRSMHVMQILSNADIYLLIPTYQFLLHVSKMQSINLAIHTPFKNAQHAWNEVPPMNSHADVWAHLTD